MLALALIMLVFHKKLTTLSLLGISVIFLVVVSNHSFSQKSTARFLYWKPAATSSALGGIGVSYFQDAFASFYNPAGLAFGPTVSASGSFVKLLPFFGNEANSFMGVSSRIEGFGTIGVSTGLYWRGKQARTDQAPTIIEIFEPMHWQAKISFATGLSDQIAVGASVSALGMNFSPWGTGVERGRGMKNTFLVDLGAFANSLLPEATLVVPGSIGETILSELADRRVREGITLGLSVFNIGPRISFIDASQSDPPPTTLLLGAVYYPLTSVLGSSMVAVELEKRLYEEGTLDNVHVGAELRVLHLVALRVGYNQAAKEKSSSFFTIGAGVTLKYFSFNIARYRQAVLPTWHYDGTFFLEF